MVFTYFSIMKFYFYLCVFCFVKALKQNSFKRKIQLLYPVELLAPVIGNGFRGEANRDILSCFGNRDFGPPTHLDALICMIQTSIPTLNIRECSNVFGLRQVRVSTVGNIEVFKVAKLPEEISYHSQEISIINATRFAELAHSRPGVHQEVTKMIPAEPLYLCVRSIDWNNNHANSSSSFSIEFGEVNPRDSASRIKFRNLSLLHLLYITIVTSSIFLLPYLISLLTAVYVFNRGMKLFVSAFVLSVAVVGLGPLMLTAKNRHLAWHYVRYFFTRGHAIETTLLIQEKVPFFQAIFFSSLLVVVGTAFSSALYTCLGIGREAKNAILCLTLSLASAWLVFFLCRAFSRFIRYVSYYILSYRLTEVDHTHVT